MSTMLLISFFVGLLYITGVGLTFMRWAREMSSTPWLVFASLVWPFAWIAFGVAYLCMLVGELHIKVGKAWPR